MTIRFTNQKWIGEADAFGLFAGARLFEPILHRTAFEDLPIRARKCLQRLQVSDLNDLRRLTQADILLCKNTGIITVNAIVQFAHQFGISIPAH